MIKNIKKTVGFLFIVVFCTIVAAWMPQMARAAEEVAIDENNFPDEVFRRCVCKFDKDGNKKLSEQEITKATTFKHIGRIIGSTIEIKSLKGIEYLTALTTLDCSYNQLTSLDLSHNTRLVTLYCEQNELTNLDLSHNTALEVLRCYENQLTSLNLSHSIALTFLNCYENQLTSLDLSHNMALTFLNCSQNQLTSLDLSHNTALTSLDCSQNPLTSLDLSHNTALTSLAYRHNQLTSLDLSHNTALTSLGCDDNQLTSLDLSHNTALTHLGCSNNQLTSLDLSRHTALKVLVCFRNQLTSLDLSHNTALKDLRCYENPLVELKLNRKTYSILPLYIEDLHGKNISVTDLQNVTETEIYDSNHNKLSLIKVTKTTQPATYKVNGKNFTIIYANTVTPAPSTNPSIPSDSHIFSDHSYSSPVTDGSIVVYGNGMTKKINDKKVNNRVSIVYTDILASYKYTTNSKGVIKPSVGKVIVAVTKSAAKPTISNKNKVTDTSASKMAKAKIKNGQITVTAVGKEGGLAYLWVMDTGNKGVSACRPVNVKLLPKKLEIQSTSGSKLAKNTEVKKGSTLDVCVAGFVGSAKAEDGTYTVTVDSKYNNYVTVTPADGSTNKFTITAKDLENDKKTKVAVTFKCDQNNKKTKLSLVITK